MNVDVLLRFNLWRRSLGYNFVVITKAVTKSHTIALTHVQACCHSVSATMCTAVPQKARDTFKQCLVGQHLDRNVQLVNISFASDECMKLSLDGAQPFPVHLIASSSSWSKLGCCQAPSLVRHFIWLARISFPASTFLFCLFPTDKTVYW